MKKFLALLVVCFLSVGADSPPGFETQDLYGDTINYSGNVGTTAIAIPTSADKVISETIIRVPDQSPSTRTLQVSFTSIAGPWMTLAIGEYIAWSVKGTKKQFWIKGSTANVEYEIIVNYETY